VIPDSKVGPFDPNGNLFWKGRHHLFYIFLVEDDRFPKKVASPFGHASSKDLINWTIHPWALEPEPGGPDGEGKCWSGDGFVWDGKPAIAYWGDRGQTCLATSDDDMLVHWRKHPANPVIPAQPVEGQVQRGDHAPYIWEENGSWYCIRGGHLPGEGDTVFLFKSADLIHWDYLHPLYRPQRRWTEPYEDMACPEFFKLGDKFVVLGLSHALGCHYYIGKWENERFIPEYHGRMNWPGGRYGAPESHVDDTGRRILWVWAQQSANDKASFWPEVLSIPRVLTLSEDKSYLEIRPVEELTELRGKGFRKRSVYLPSGQEISFDEISGDSLEILAGFDPGNAKGIGIRVLCSPDDQEYTGITVDLERKKLAIDVSHSSLDRPDVYQMFNHFWRVGKGVSENKTVLVQEAPFELGPGEALELQVYIDRCMVDVFANGRQALCMQVFPVREDSVGVKFIAGGGNAEIRKLQAWEMGELTYSK
jgi:beta-fructofuranosidase